MRVGAALPAPLRRAALLAAAFLLLAAPRGAAANVTLVSFRAQGDAAGVNLQWETATELDTVGFRLRRAASASGPFQVLSGSFVAARGGPAEGGSYQWRDGAAPAGQAAYYQLDSVDFDQGTVTYDRVVCAIPGGGACAPPPTATRPTSPAPSATLRPSATPRPSATARDPSRTPRPTPTARASRTPRPVATDPGAGVTPAARPSGSPRPGTTASAAAAATRAATVAGGTLPAAGARTATVGRPVAAGTASPAAELSPAIDQNPSAQGLAPTGVAASPAVGSPPPISPAAAQASTLVASADAGATRIPRAAGVSGRSLGGAPDEALPSRPLPAGLVAAGLGLLLAALGWRMLQLVRRG